MRNYLLAAVAAAALSSPAMAREDSLYVGIDGGVMLVEDTSLDYDTDDFDLTPSDLDVDDAIIIDHNLGYDIDLVAGYDFGPVRVEGEVAYKRAGLDEVQLATDFFFSPNPTEPYDVEGSLRIFSIMANAMLDFGDEDGWSGYIGAGGGYANVRYEVDIDGTGVDESERDSSFAWQIIAGIRKAISPNLDLGLKYRFFNASKLEFEDDSSGFSETLDGRVKTHSLMLSLIYNFWTPAPPPPPPPPPMAPPPPPPPPATQTCPDGSVILATEACPPPPPPPPPPPEPERG